MLTVQRKAQRPGTPSARLVLGHAQRQRLRWRTAVEGGEEIGLLLPRGTLLADGDLLEADDGRLVLVVAADEDLIEVADVDPARLARAAYHLGNRHASVEVTDGAVRTPADAVIESMLHTLGFAPRTVRAPFHPEPGAYGAAGHAHSSEARHGGVIHEFAPAPRRT